MSNYILLGFPGSGKTTVAKFFSDNMKNVNIIEMGDLVRDKYVLMNEKNEYATLVEYANSVFRKKKYLEFVSMIDKKTRDNIIFVGPRTVQEVQYLCDNFDIKSIIGLDCEKEERLNRRKKQNKYNNKEYFNKRDEIEEKWGLSKTLECCDVVYDTTKLTPSDIYRLIIEN